MAFWSRWFGPRQPRPAPPAQAPRAPEPPPEFPYPLVAVPGASAVDEWRRLREAWRAEGACPVMLGDRDELTQLAELLASDGETPGELLAAARGRTAAAFFAERLREHRDLHEGADRSGDERPGVPADGLHVPRGEWPSAPTPHALFAHDDLLSGRPKPLVYVARIPTPDPWAIPAFLRYGGWNECPPAEDQVAVHRHWHASHGAEIYSIVGAVVECWVARPPGEEGAAEALAREQYLYCADIVEQGTETLRALAGGLKDADAWFFWWD